MENGMVVGGRFVRTRPLLTPQSREAGSSDVLTWRRGVDVEGWGVERSQRLGFQSATRTRLANGLHPGAYA